MVGQGEELQATAEGLRCLQNVLCAFVVGVNNRNTTAKISSSHFEDKSTRSLCNFVITICNYNLFVILPFSCQVQRRILRQWFLHVSVTLFGRTDNCNIFNNSKAF